MIDRLWFSLGIAASFLFACQVEAATPNPVFRLGAKAPPGLLSAPVSTKDGHCTITPPKGWVVQVLSGSLRITPHSAGTSDIVTLGYVSDTTYDQHVIALETFKEHHPSSVLIGDSVSDADSYLTSYTIETGTDLYFYHRAGIYSCVGVGHGNNPNSLGIIANSLMTITSAH